MNNGSHTSSAPGTLVPKSLDRYKVKTHCDATNMSVVIEVGIDKIGNYMWYASYICDQTHCPNEGSEKRCPFAKPDKALVAAVPRKNDFEKKIKLPPLRKK